MTVFSGRSMGRMSQSMAKCLSGGYTNHCEKKDQAPMRSLRNKVTKDMRAHLSLFAIASCFGAPLTNLARQPVEIRIPSSAPPKSSRTGGVEEWNCALLGDNNASWPGTFPTSSWEIVKSETRVSHRVYMLPKLGWQLDRS